MSYVEQLTIPSTRRLVTDDEEAAYLKRVEEAREQLRCFAKERGIEVCDKID
jgi:hypothetical protein